MTAGRDIRIVRPEERDWPAILDVLRPANFHHIGGPEMEAFPLEDCFVAVVDGRIMGVGGYRVLSDTLAKTTLLAVHPDAAGLRLGPMLQDARLDHLRGIGIQSVTTNTDDPRVVAWLERSYGFRRTGKTVAKLADFGRSDATHWISLRVDWGESD